MTEDTSTYVEVPLTGSLNARYDLSGHKLDQIASGFRPSIHFQTDGKPPKVWLQRYVVNAVVTVTGTPAMMVVRLWPKNPARHWLTQEWSASKHDTRRIGQFIASAGRSGLSLDGVWINVTVRRRWIWQRRI